MGDQHVLILGTLGTVLVMFWWLDHRSCQLGVSRDLSRRSRGATLSKSLATMDVENALELPKNALEAVFAKKSASGNDFLRGPCVGAIIGCSYVRKIAISGLAYVLQT